MEGIGRLTFGLDIIQGKLYVRGDSKVFRFQNGKSESLFLQRKNPRRIAWTTLYRRQHKKGISEVSGILYFPLLHLARSLGFCLRYCFSAGFRWWGCDRRRRTSEGRITRQRMDANDSKSLRCLFLLRCYSWKDIQQRNCAEGNKH